MTGLSAESMYNVIMMTRTTIRIQESLLDELKKRALKNRHSLTEEIHQLLMSALREQPPRKKIELPVFYGGTGVHPGIDITDTSSIIEMLDMEDVQRWRTDQDDDAAE